MESSSKHESAPWRPRKYVMVGMGAILGVSAVTIVTSIIFQPADISFTVTDFSNDYNDRLQGRNFTFNLNAHNPSPHAGVVYRSVLVSMQLRNNEKPSVKRTSVPARVTNDESKLRQEKKSNFTMVVKAFLDKEFYGFYSSKASATVMVFAEARFKVWRARSRVYNIRVKCSGIYLVPFSREQSGPANCSATN